MLIHNAEIYDPGREPSAPADIRIVDGHVIAIGSLPASPGERVLDAGNCAVLPGLHDHHIHLLSYAASLQSVHCGPPQVRTEVQLRSMLLADTSSGWLRGYGYHESVAGEIDRDWLDRCLPDRAVRIQHRSGRLWILNSAALSELRSVGHSTAGDAIDLPENGRIYDADQALGVLLGRHLPPVGIASRRLASFGVTSLTDMTPSNEPENVEILCDLRRSGALLQRISVAGSAALPFPWSADEVTVAATKIDLHDSNLPPFEQICDQIRKSHSRRRSVAIHCVTEVELVFALAALREAGATDGDRIEHASVTPPHLLDELKTLGLMVVTQPNFIAERGDAYLHDIPDEELPWLYRVRSFLDGGVPLAGGTDAPFGNPDPWVAIQSAVSRRTAAGHPLGPREAVTPEQALALFLGSAAEPDQPRAISVGAAADLCILNQPWRQARAVLTSDLVATTVCAGELAYDRTLDSL
jgi:predicted amidohydrolase YtcJ